MWSWPTAYLRRLRARLRALLSTPSQLSTLQILINHLDHQQQETNDLLRELTVALAGRLPTTPVTPPLMLPRASPLPPATSPPLDSPVQRPSHRRLTDADVVLADRAYLATEQEKRRLAAAQAARENQRIV